MDDYERTYPIKGVAYDARRGVTTESRQLCLIIFRGDEKIGVIAPMEDGWAIREATGCKTVPKLRAQTVPVAITDLLQYRQRKNLP